MHNREFEIFGLKGFTTMSNFHFQDRQLSLKAKGLLSLMLSLPKDWDYSINGLVTLSKDGRDSVRATLDELKQAEYIKIDRYQSEKGQFKYKYRIYYLPFPYWLKMQNSTIYGNSTLDSNEPDTGLPHTELPDTENPIQQNTNKQNTNKQKDKYDTKALVKGKEIKHNILTYELIDKNYISETENSSFLFDDYFSELINQGKTYKELLKLTDYIVDRVISRNFKDENYNNIKNKFGYFKNSMESNMNKLNNLSDQDLFNPDEYDWLNDEEEEFEL